LYRTIYLEGANNAAAVVLEVAKCVVALVARGDAAVQHVIVAIAVRCAFVSGGKIRIVVWCATR